jgi:signal transduction histidine kinase
MDTAAKAQVPETRLEEAELLLRLRQFILLRWVAVAGVLVSVATAQVIFRIQVALTPVLATCASVAACNVAFWLWARSDDRLARTGRALAYAQIVTDLLGLTILLHLTGGIENPFFLFYFFHVGFSIILLESRDVHRVTILAISLFAAMVGAEYAGWLPHVRLAGFLPGELYRQSAYVLAVLVAFAATLSLVSIAATRMMTELSKRREEQAQAKRLELEQVRRQLDELDRMRTFFLALASHDLKTPLAVAINYIQTIVDGFAGEVGPKQRSWMERSVVRLQELLQLIDDFLDVSQLDQARIAQELEPTCLETIVQQVVAEISPRALDRQVTIQTTIPSNLAWVLGSPKRLHRLLINLLDNGCKFTPKGGLVTLTLAEEDDCVRIDVTDTGAGIPASYLPHIFEDYFRVRRQEFIPGAGLGLSTARRIVEAHGGKIWVESPYRPDQPGSRFTFCLQKANTTQADPGLTKERQVAGEGSECEP